MSTRSSASEYSYLAHWSAIYLEPLRSTIGIDAIRTAVEYEYRPPRRTEYRFAEYEYRFAEYEYGASAKAARK